MPEASWPSAKEFQHRVGLLPEINRPILNYYAQGAGVSGGKSSPVQAKNTLSGQWVNRGVHLAQVSELPEPGGISGAIDFKKMPEVEMRAGIERWLEMKPII